MRICFVALYAVGPAVALVALLRRRVHPSAPARRVTGWRRYVPAVLLPIEWVLPPILISTGTGELQGAWPALQLLGLAVGVAGAAVLVWAAVVLGRFLTHDAIVRQDHSLVTRGPYRWVRHPVYSGYLALLLGSGLGMPNAYVLLVWPIAVAGIAIQADSEERVLALTFGRDFKQYAARTGRLVPSLRKTM